MVERIYDLTAVALIFSVNLIWFKPPFTFEVSFDQVRLAGFGLVGRDSSRYRFSRVVSDRSPLVIEFFERLFSAGALFQSDLAKLVLRILEQLAGALRVLVNVRELARNNRLDSVNLVRDRGGESAGNASLSSAGWFSGNNLRARSFVAWFTGPDARWGCRRFSCRDCRRTVVPGSEEGDCGCAFDSVAPRRLWAGTFIWIFYIIRGDLSLAKLRTLISPHPVEQAVEEQG